MLRELTANHAVADSIPLLSCPFGGIRRAEVVLQGHSNDQVAHLWNGGSTAI